MNFSLVSLIGRSFEFDVFIPTLSLAFEYYGEYHYHFVPVYLYCVHMCNSHIHYSPQVAERDKQKKVICKELGVDLFVLPYWWDGSLSSLATTIHRLRPDIEIPQHLLSVSIPEHVPKKDNCTIRFYVDCNECSAL